MRLTTEELSQLLRNAVNDAQELGVLRERVLKLEHKINELFDLLSDIRVRQIMDDNAPVVPTKYKS